MMSVWIARVLFCAAVFALTDAESYLTVVADVSQANALIVKPANSTAGLKGSLLLSTMGTAVKLTCIADISETPCPPQIVWLKDFSVLQSEPNVHLDVTVYSSVSTASNGLSLRSTLQFDARNGNYSGLYACRADREKNATFNFRVIDKVSYLPWLTKESVCDRKEVLFCAIHNGTGYEFLQLNPGTTSEENKFTYCASEFYMNSTYQASRPMIYPSGALEYLWPQQNPNDPYLSHCVLARKADLDKRLGRLPEIISLINHGGSMTVLIVSGPVILAVVLFVLIWKADLSKCRLTDSTSFGVIPV